MQPNPENQKACWKCKKPLPTELQVRIPFRAICEHCHSYLHCCRNCQHYKIGLPNDCEVPDTDPISDREAFNYCESFKLLGKGPSPKIDPKDVEKRLFG